MIIHLPVLPNIQCAVLNILSILNGYSVFQCAVLKRVFSEVSVLHNAGCPSFCMKIVMFLFHVLFCSALSMDTTWSKLVLNPVLVP